MTLIHVLVIIALIATVIVMIIGVGAMSSSSSLDEDYGESFMWWRVGLQGLTLLLLIVALFLL